MTEQLSLFPAPKRRPAVCGPRVVEPKRERRLSQKQRILERLRHGPATNHELNAIGFRYGARVKELRDAGYKVTSEDLGGGLWRFTLIAEPPEVCTGNQTGCANYAGYRKLETRFSDGSR